MRSEEPSWVEARERASRANGWFIPEFIDLAVRNIAELFLHQAKLEAWIAPYHIPENREVAPANPPKRVGIVMAGNIPLVGFHDWLAVFLSGHIAVIKPSSKDDVLIRHLIKQLAEWEPASTRFTLIQEMLKDCDAYIATGSNNSAGYFDYYFGRFPHIIRRNRSSVAILTGTESPAELDRLADDVHQYFGLGCRNVTKIFVPEGYDFVPLIETFKRYQWMADHHKYKNNFDYNLAINLLNKVYYMSTEALMLVEKESIFSPISQLHYGFYPDLTVLQTSLIAHPEVQCIVGTGFTPFGEAQNPSVETFADGVDTLEFLNNL